MSVAEEVASATSAGRRKQYLLFAVGDIRCYVELTRLNSVVPWATLLPAEEDAVIGWLNYRGNRVPVIDMAKQVLGEETSRTLGSRILLLECSGRQVGALVSEAFAIGTEEDIATSGMERLDPCEVLTSAIARLP